MGEEKAISYDHRGEEVEYQMGEEKAISFDHRCEEVIAWSVRWAKKKPFPLIIDVKKS